MTNEYKSQSAESEIGLSRTDIYKIALDTRNLEISLFWQRCNYFLILNSALAYGYISLNDKNLSTPVTILGLIVCVFWYRVALGSKYWQERWEAKLNRLEHKFRSEGYFPSDVTLFSATWHEIKREVADSLSSSKHTMFERLVDMQILTKPSVTQSMIYLVLTFSASWIAVFFYQVFQLIDRFVV